MFMKPHEGLIQGDFVAVCGFLFSHVRLFATPWTIAHQAPLSMGILQASILEWVAIPSPADLPNPGLRPGSPALQEDSFTAELSGIETFHIVVQWLSRV